jgi:UDP-N-acetylmuramyl pentapeptide phosphotransferase/UDP-N-acetylglucosamine-1-phosphate transferase
MKSLHLLLQIELLSDYRYALLSFVTAFVITLIAILPIISLIKKYRLYDFPNERKEHTAPIPTMGGIAIVAGMMVALFLWFPFGNYIGQICFFLSIAVLFALGIMDDLKDISAKYKLVVQLSLALLIALSGIRIQSFEGLFGINDLSLSAQYTITILAIVLITNAFNLIDGIDGLAGGLSFMSLITLGIFLTMSGDVNTALIAFALAGAVFAFLYFNFNPAKIFMGDTGSLVLGFVIAVLCIRLLQVNLIAAKPVLLHAPLFVLGVVLIPVFDTTRVFALRIWKGQSPFVADKAHMHHLLTHAGYNHGFTARLICFIHGFILIEVLWLQNLRQEVVLAILAGLMLLMIVIFKHLSRFRQGKPTYFPAENLTG